MVKESNRLTSESANMYILDSDRQRDESYVYLTQSFIIDHFISRGIGDIHSEADLLKEAFPKWKEAKLATYKGLKIQEEILNSLSLEGIREDLRGMRKEYIFYLKNSKLGIENREKIKSMVFRLEHSVSIINEITNTDGADTANSVEKFYEPFLKTVLDKRMRRESNPWIDFITSPKKQQD